MKKILVLLISLIAVCTSFSQQTGHRITLEMEGYVDTLAYLGHYFGDKLSISDTSRVNNGKVVFAGEEPLKQGVYFLVSQNKKKLFEFLVGEDQEFGIRSSATGLPEDTRIDGSSENELFYDYLRYNHESYERIRALQSAYQQLPPDHDSLDLLREETARINQQNIDYKLNMIDSHPGSFTALLLSAMREPDVPDFFTPDGRHDSLAAYLYYRNHYWDHIDLGDDRFLRTPVFHRKLEKYFDDVIPAHPDSIIAEIDQMVEATGDNAEMRDYLLWYLANRYETSNIMGYDRIFVHMVDRYFTRQSYDWLHPEVQSNMIDHVDKLRKVLIGEFAPTLLMADTSNNFINLYQVDAEFTVVIFWSGSCGECQRELKALNELYRSGDYDMGIYSVNTDTSFNKWKEYIRKYGLEWVNVNGNLSLTGDYHDLYDIYSTPVIYVLDREKVIIAKRIAADSIAGILRRHIQMKSN